MFIDTHCHINIMVKESFDRLLTDQELHDAAAVIEQAASKFPRRTSAAAAYLSTSQKAGKVGFQVFSARAIASTH